MIAATRANTKLGEKVLVPIHGEFLNQEQICLEYEVVLALRCKVKPEEQVVATGEEPLPEFIEFNDEMAYKLET